MVGIWGSVIAVAAVIISLILFGSKEKMVGKEIAPDDITEFFYTFSSSAYPPVYQRYRFYTENGKYIFYHEKREGKTWPLKESDITYSVSVHLSAEEWSEFLELLNGGKAKKREEAVGAGNLSPALFLYWNGDRSKYQEFSFASLNVQQKFEEFCAALTELHAK